MVEKRVVNADLAWKWGLSLVFSPPLLQASASREEVRHSGRESREAKRDKKDPWKPTWARGTTLS